MIFDELDKKMRMYEQSLDQIILPELYMAARLDGRGFTRLTKEICRFEAPFDVRFKSMMVYARRQSLLFENRSWYVKNCPLVKNMRK